MSATLDQILEMIESREKLMKDAENFLNSHEDKNGNLSADDERHYKFLRDQIGKATANIDVQVGWAKADADPQYREMMKALRPLGSTSNYTVLDGAGGGIIGINNKPRTSQEYDRYFFNAVRNNFKMVNEYLREGQDVNGGFLLPTEFHDALVTELTEENVMRQIATVITTQSQHKVNLVANRPAASWIGEGQSVNFSNETFSQVSLDAYKLAVGVKVSNELLQDSFYNLENHFVEEFGRAMGNAEEDSFINGNSTGVTKQPEGFLTTLSTVSDAQVTTATSSLTADDLLSLVYALPRAYRKNASWLMHDSTLERIRKLKDDTKNYLLTPALTAGEPDRLLGYPIYTSAYFPANISSGSTVAAFGDFSRYVIADRATRTFKPLRELYAESDLTAYLMIERVDGKLIDTRAIKILKLR